MLSNLTSSESGVSYGLTGCFNGRPSETPTQHVVGAGESAPTMERCTRLGGLAWREPGEDPANDYGLDLVVCLPRRPGGWPSCQIRPLPTCSMADPHDAISFRGLLHRSQGRIGTRL